MTDLVRRVAAAAPADADDVDANQTVSKVARRLVPFLVACFFAAYLDRVNVGFAALSMNADLGFSSEIFGFGAGIFFIGYSLFEAPSNFILHRVGARRWIARIMVSWGLVSALMAFVWDSASFLALRFLLGVAEAGFAPGAILYLTYWIPLERRARILGAFLLAVPLSSAVGAPLSSLALAAMDGVAGLKGWQWLFLLEAIPSMLLGIVAFFYLTDKPKDADWLTPAERTWLQARLDGEQAANNASHDEAFWRTLRHPRVLALGVAYFGVVSSLYGVGFWLPQIVHGFGYGVIESGFVTAIPYVCAAIAMVVWSRHSDRKGERFWHTALPALAAAMGLAASGYAGSPTTAMLSLSVAATGTLAAMPPFWTLPTAFLSGLGAAVGIALVNSIGNLAGFFGPYLVGWIKTGTGDFSSALTALAIGPILCAVIVLRLRGPSPASLPSPRSPRTTA